MGDFGLEEVGNGCCIPNVSRIECRAVMSSTIDRAVRILVLGDSGVGKTSLVHLIAHNSPLTDISYTVGASIEVKLHHFKEGTQSEKPIWIELCDVGGSHSHRNSRHVFYNNCHGIILVHDLANRKSQQNLDIWLKEVTENEKGSGKRDTGALWDETVSDDQFHGGGKKSLNRENSFHDLDIPLLVIGTKQDLAFDRTTATSGLPVRTRRKSYIAEEFGAEEIHLNCTEEKSLIAGTSSSSKLARFFDKVIERQFNTRTTTWESSGPMGPSPPSPRTERRRFLWGSPTKHKENKGSTHTHKSVVCEYHPKGCTSWMDPSKQEERGQSPKTPISPIAQRR